MIKNRNKILTTVFLLAFGGFQAASAATITSSIGNTASGLSDGDVPATFLLGTIQSGQAAPFDTGCGSEILDPPGSCSASWNFAYGAISDPIISASITLGIVDHDSSASGSQLSVFDINGNDLTTSLDSLFETAGDGLDGMYNEYTINLGSGVFASLLSGSTSVSLDLDGSGLTACALAFLCGGNLFQESAFNGANLIFSTLTIETGSLPAVPIPAAAPLFASAIFLMGLYRRRVARSGA